MRVRSGQVNMVASAAVRWTTYAAKKSKATRVSAGHTQRTRGTYFRDAEIRSDRPTEQDRPEELGRQLTQLVTHFRLRQPREHGAERDTAHPVVQKHREIGL